VTHLTLCYWLAKIIFVWYCFRFWNYIVFWWKYWWRRWFWRRWRFRRWRWNLGLKWENYFPRNVNSVRYVRMYIRVGYFFVSALPLFLLSHLCAIKCNTIHSTAVLWYCHRWSTFLFIVAAIIIFTKPKVVTFDTESSVIEMQKACSCHFGNQYEWSKSKHCAKHGRWLFELTCKLTTILWSIWPSVLTAAMKVLICFTSLSFFRKAFVFSLDFLLLINQNVYYTCWYV